MHKILALSVSLVAAPALAQAPTPGAVQTARCAPIEPAHLALAQATIDFVWPRGTYERMMKGTMDQMMDSIFQSMFDMKLGDLVPQDAKGTQDPQAARLTMREAMEKADPHFQERMRITTRVMMDEMIPIMNRIEPEIRGGLARAYARKFTDDQLADMNRFFATPTGKIYASEAMLTMMDPEVMSAVTKFAPDFIREMPRIMKKVEAASAGLPPPPKSQVIVKPAQ